MDLNAPLGMRPPPQRPRRFVPIVVCSLAALAATGLVLVIATADPRGGEPSASALIPPKPIAAAPVPPDPTPTGSIAPPRLAGTAPDAQGRIASLESGVKVYRGGDVRTGDVGPARGPVVIDVTKALDEPARKKTATTANLGVPSAPLPSLVTGTPPSTGAGKPRVAIFVSGMGLSAAATRTATDTMPPAVDLAFVPYGETVAAAVDSAMAKGHEILLQLPMQTPQGQKPGPHALRPAEPAHEVDADIGWLMSRIGGYAGVTNLLGGAVTADSATMTTILKAVAGRGLFFVDDGTSPRSVAPNLAPGLGLAALQADIVLDATGDPAVVSANLEKLVAIARRKGQAIGMASGLPEHMGTVARFAASLDSKGVALVPVGTLAGRGASVATAR